MPSRPRPLPRSLGDAFSVADARAAGVTSGRLGRRDLEHPFHGVRQHPQKPRPEDEERPPSTFELARRREVHKLEAYAQVMGPAAFLAGRTAAVHLGLSVTPGTELVVGVIAPDRAPRGVGVRGVKLAPNLADVAAHLDIRATTPATTWAMLAAELDVRALVALGDQIVRVPRDRRGDQRPDERIGTLEQLERAVTAGRRVGIAKLREALPLIRVGSASPLETDFRLDAASGGLAEPKLDVEIRDRGGRLLGITEVVYPEFRTVVEIEGDHHRTDRKQWNRDIEKYAAYASEGWEVVRLTSSHIRGRQPQAVEIVRRVLLRRGWSPG